MIICYSINNIPIRLSDERWMHITSRHIELTDEKDKVIETVSNPDFIQNGDFGEVLSVKHYSRTSMTSKYLVVIYKEINQYDGFIITAYFTNKPNEKREIIWKL